MMKTIMAVAVFACVTSTAYAEISGFYVNGQLGSSWDRASSINHHFFDDDIELNQLSFDSGNKAVFSGGVGIGYNFKSKFDIPIRTELMFTMRGES